MSHLQHSDAHGNAGLTLCPYRAKEDHGVCIAIHSRGERTMESLLYELLEYGVGALFGFSLGVLALALLRTNDVDNLSTPPTRHSQVVSALWRRNAATLF